MGGKFGIDILDDDYEEIRSIGERRRSFISSYLSALNKILRSFGRFFAVVGVIYLLQFLLNVMLILTIISHMDERSGGGSIIGIIGLIAVAINFALIAWFAMICYDFVDIQVSKIKNDLDFNYDIYQENKKMSQEILERALKRAGEIVQTISIHGAVTAPVTMTGIGDTHVSVSGEAETNESLAKAIALLVAYCEESHNEEAIRNARSIAVEASKADKNNNIIMTSWTKIVALLPTVADVFTIVEGISRLMGK